MDHSHAAAHLLVEQYLLGELTAEVRDEFEEHFFDCEECAAELRMTSAFLQATRKELQKPEAEVENQAIPFPVANPAPRKILSWRPILALSALAACLLVLLYQNTVTLPHLRNEVATLDMPEVLPSISLVGGNSRGGELPSASRNGAESVLLQIDIPAEDRFASYTCLFYTPQHQLVGTVEVSAQAAKDTIPILVPLRSNMGGVYSLEIRGHDPKDAGSSASGVQLATYRFTVNAGVAGEGH
jgi:hypothetical protein